MHRTIRIAAAISAAAMVAVSAATAPAQAAGPLVLFQDSGFAGTSWSFTATNGNISGSGGDRVSSIVNQDVNAWVVYQHDTYRGRSYCVLPGQSLYDLHEQQWQFGDAISSVRRRPDGTCHDNPMFLSP
ncbi:beta/gamma crystallin-related protein [Nonomuraea wenchangensis]|uniref:Beta/Gamma crystallin n=1 Tax=Nonomuraea wenchangensis TaxID=568860 RepID=A0A1I0KKF1_9ACTN|nr:beta/gamma crystallin-related protein [Nonomuraea wenchangensis]SEU25471.1 Beta/Gamma crystallin [Nonomuraea wenchangensis]